MKLFKVTFLGLVLAGSYSMPAVAEAFMNLAAAKLNFYIMSEDEQKTLQKFALSVNNTKKLDLASGLKEGILVIVKQARSTACCLEHDEELEEQVTRGRCLTCGDIACVTRSTKCACSGVNLKVSAKEMHPDNEFVISVGERGKLKIKMTRKK